MATHSSILAWRIPWTEEPGRLPSMGSQRVRHNLACTRANTALAGVSGGFRESALVRCVAQSLTHSEHNDPRSPYQEEEKQWFVFCDS